MEEKEVSVEQQAESVMTDDFDLFGDEDTNQPGEDQEETVVDQEDAQQDQEDKPQDESFEIEFLGEKKTLTKDELIAAAQKGMNYDHVKEKADKADRYESSFKAVERLAQAAGMDVDAYLKSVEDEISTRELDELKEKGMDEETARELLTLRKEKAVNTAQQQETAKQQERVKAWDEFADYFGGWENAPFKPEKGLDDFPKAMMENISKGDSPLVAYLKYAVKENEVKTAVKTATEQNKEKSPGSAKGQSKPLHDSAFLSGLFGED